MNKKLITLLALVASIALIAGLFLGRVLFSGGEAPKQENTDAATEESAGAATLWTCSMHPQIQQPEPGDCPICGMDLIPLEEDSQGASGPREMSMSEASRALAEIQTSEVVQAYPETKVRLVGKLEYDETREKSLSARFPARIEELFVNYTGIRVNKGEHLAEVYSPELLTAQRELISAHRADPDGSITGAAREKLRLWGLLPEQVDAIIENGVAKDRFILKAPMGGVVAEKHIKEGGYIDTGEPLFRIVDLTVLWANLDAYESDLSWLRFGQEVSFTVESFPGETFHGQIVFIEPELDRKTRTVPVRVNVPNPDQRLKPGMFVRAVVAARLADDGKVYAPEFAGKWISPMHPEVIKDHPGQCDVCGMDLVPAEELGYVDNENEPAPLVIPSSAVLRTGKRAVVYVEKPDTERPTYEGREITLGPRAGDVFLVASGLKAGERVVTQGAFKIDSALQIQAKPSMMNPEEVTDNETAGNGGAASITPPEITANQVQPLLPPYLALQKALAGDNLEAAKKAIQQLMEVTGHAGELAELVHKMLAAGDLGSIRRPHFDSLSQALIAALENATNLPGSTTLYRMHCPMVYDDAGADWLQDAEALRNPYFGASMLKCGETKEQISVNAPAGADDDVLRIEAETASALIDDYLKLQSALADDNLKAAKQAVQSMTTLAGPDGALPDLLQTMLDAENLESLRKPHFETLSNALIRAAQDNPEAMPDHLMIMHCPMVYGDRGADWLQNSEPLQNPYFGASMLKCGEIKEHLHEKPDANQKHAP